MYLKGVTKKLGKAVGATGDVTKMAEALAKYKEVKAELNAPPAKKVQNKKMIFQLQNLNFRWSPTKSRASPLLKRKSLWRSTAVRKRRRKRKRQVLKLFFSFFLYFQKILFFCVRKMFFSVFRKYFIFIFKKYFFCFRKKVFLVFKKQLFTFRRRQRKRKSRPKSRLLKSHQLRTARKRRRKRRNESWRPRKNEHTFFFEHMCGIPHFNLNRLPLWPHTTKSES